MRATDAAGNQDQSPASRTWTVSAPPPPGTCTQTLNPGANVASAVSGAAAGSTICLNAGSYGSVALTNVSKASDVTVRSASGNSASLYPQLNNVRHVRLESLTLSGMYLIDARDVSIVGNTFTGMSRVDTTQTTPNANIRIDSNTFDNITACGSCYEGQLTIRGYNNTQSIGVKITNNHFGDLGGSDGIQVIGGAYGAEIRQGNEFSGFKQAGYTAHVDPIQLYGSSHTVITGNYFHHNNDASAIMAPDGGTAEQITNNVFVGAAYFPAIQLGSHTGDLVAHNTIVGMQVTFAHKTGLPPARATSCATTSSPVPAACTCRADRSPSRTTTCSRPGLAPAPTTCTARRRSSAARRRRRWRASG